ncbi:Transcriptional regulatory protein LiaR [Geobacillus sp. BCO2]|nr:Transcriptional regulatory protein LiaR [Geobacillus sp. BCO2]
MDGIRQLLEREPDMEVVGAVFSPTELEKDIADFQPDIIVIDAPSQRENNLIWIKNISSQFPASKVVMLSGDDNTEYVHAVHEAGAYAFVSKCDSAETLIHAIRESYRGVKSFPADLAFHDGSPLTDMELAVLDLIARDKTNSEIGEQLNISKRTVEHHVSSILRNFASNHEREQSEKRLGSDCSSNHVWWRQFRRQNHPMFKDGSSDWKKVYAVSASATISPSLVLFLRIDIAPYVSICGKLLGIHPADAGAVKERRHPPFAGVKQLGDHGTKPTVV